MAGHRNKASVPSLESRSLMMKRFRFLVYFLVISAVQFTEDKGAGKFVEVVGRGVVGGAHGWFVGVLKGKIAEWDGKRSVGGGGRSGARETKETIEGLGGEGRGDVVETVAAAVVCGWLQGVPKVFGVDAMLVDEIRGVVAEKRASRRREVEMADGTAAAAAVQPGSFETEDEAASESASEYGVAVESSQTELQIEL